MTSPPALLPLRPRRLVVRGVNWLGDAVMTTPALQRLRERFPDAHLCLFTPRKLESLWQGFPHVDSVLAFEDREGVWAAAGRLRRERFDAALVLPNSPRSALETFLAGIPARVGYARPWRVCLLTHRVPPRPEEWPTRARSAAQVRRMVSTFPPPAAPRLADASHHLFQYLRLVAALGGDPAPVAPRLEVPAAECEAVQGRFGFARDLSRNRFLVGVHAGAEYGPAKRWPEECYVEAVAQILAAVPCQVWVLGGPGERGQAGRLTTRMQGASPPHRDAVRCLAGQTSLRELCAALRACDVLLTNDSGPMHVAAAVGTPVVVPFGSTSPELTGPGLPGDSRHVVLRASVPCAPCFRRDCPIDFRCMKGIPVEQATRAVLECLKSKSGV
jgi:lipopolysaccharide heptosyltransferase II